MRHAKLEHVVPKLEHVVPLSIRILRVDRVELGVEVENAQHVAIKGNEVEDKVDKVHQPLLRTLIGQEVQLVSGIGAAHAASRDGDVTSRLLLLRRAARCVFKGVEVALHFKDGMA